MTLSDLPTVLDGRLAVAANTSVRRSLCQPHTLQLVWGEGSEREEFETQSPQLAAWIVSLPSTIEGGDLVKRAIEDLHLTDQDARDLVVSLFQNGLLSSEVQYPSGGQDLWLKLNWSDALELHRATRHTRWRHEYPPNPQVMTWYHGDKVVEPDTPRPVVPDDVSDAAVSLPPPSDVVFSHQLLATLERRRTSRNFTNATITTQQLADIMHWTLQPLISGMSRRYFTTQASSDGFREKHTPQPFTAYILLDPASGPHDLLRHGRVFRYSTSHHALEPVRAQVGTSYTFSDLLWGQGFADGAPAMVVLAMNWSQYMWKYRTSFAYRMAHLDVGAFAQTALVVATAIGLRTFVTPAMDDERMAGLLGIDDSTQAPTYVIALGA